jgi:hypothetical protein
MQLPRPHQRRRQAFARMPDHPNTIEREGHLWRTLDPPGVIGD